MHKLLFGVLFSGTLCANAQLKNKLGNVTQEDLDIRTCEFYQEADAVILYDEGASDYNDEYGLVTHRYRKMKILKETAIERADLSIDYRSDDDLENVVGLEAMVTNPDGRGHFQQIPVDQNSVYRTRINKFWSRVTLPLPQVKVGSVIEYRYRLVAKHYGMLRDWEFQQDLPVYVSTYDLQMVPNVNLMCLPQHSPRLKFETKVDKTSRAVWYKMTNIPPLTDEPYMDAPADYVQKVVFKITGYATTGGWINYMTNWDEVFRQLNSDEEFGKQLRTNIDEAADFIKSIGNKDEFGKTKAIHDFIKSSTAWNNISGVVTSRKGVKELWRTGSGSVAEINLSLVNLLNKAGLKAFPVLVSERHHGRVNSQIPVIDQFNKVIAMVSINDRNYFLDGTDKITPTHLIPADILNTTGYIVSAKNGGLIHISDKRMAAKDIMMLTGTIADDGTYSGKVQMFSRDYARCARLGMYDSSDIKKYISRNFADEIEKIDIDSFLVSNQHIDSADLEHAFNYKTRLQSTGEYSFINLALFTGFKNNPFLLENRFSNVNFGFNRSMFLTAVVDIPAAYRIDALPANTKLKNEDGTVVFVREAIYDEGQKQVVVRIKVDILKSLFTVDEYPALQKIFKNMIDLMNEQVVLKKI